MRTLIVSLSLLLVSLSSVAKNGMTNAEMNFENERMVDSIMVKLSIREKIAQLMIIEFCSDDSPKLKSKQNRLIKKEKIGGIIIMNDHLVPAVKRLNEMHSIAPIPLLITIDGEWGASMRYPELPFFPRQMQMGAFPNDSLVYRIGKAIGKECADLNIHVNFVPDVDINNNPENPVINTRSFGENREIVAAYGLAYISGLHSEGIFGSAKHFPGHGDTDVDSHKSLPVLNFSKERLDTLEAYPFKQLIANGVDMVMVSHLEVPALDSSGTPASISKPIITGYLRGELGYDGIVVTDALNMKGVSNHLEKKMIPLAAFKAGVDILLMPEDVEDSITEIEKAVKSGEISVSDIDERLRKVLMLKVRAGLFKKSYNPLVSTVNLQERMIKDSNRELIAEASNMSLCVLVNKNLSAPFEDEKALPLVNPSAKKIGYLGYKGDSFGKDFERNLSRYAEIEGVILNGSVSAEQIKNAVKRLEDCDVVILAVHNTDARPNRNFGIEPEHFKIFTDWAAEKDIIMVYMGSPYALNRIRDYSNFKGYILAFSNTFANNCAAAQLVFGGIKSVGSLPVGAGEFKQGYSVKTPKVALEYDNIYSGKREFSLKDGKIWGDYILKHAKAMTEGEESDTLSCNEPVELSSMAPFLAQLPLLGMLIDSGELRSTASLGEILDMRNSLHSSILLSDVIMHRSGLPEIKRGLAHEDIYSLPLNRNVQLLYSRANIFYINRVIEEKFGFPEASARLAEFYKSMGMYGTSVKFENGEFTVTSTLDDLGKYIYMLCSEGSYAEVRFFSPMTAQFLQMMLTYYSRNDDGLSIIRSFPAEEHDYKFYYE